MSEALAAHSIEAFVAHEDIEPSKEWQNVIEAALRSCDGLAAWMSPGFFHDLRHTFGTSLAMAGVDVTTIQAYMGHADLKTTQRYMHYAPADDEAERIGRAFTLADPRVEGAAATPLAAAA